MEEETIAQRGYTQASDYQWASVRDRHWIIDYRAFESDAPELKI